MEQKLEKQNAELSQERDCYADKFNEKLEKVEKQKNEAIKNLNESYKEQIESLSKDKTELSSQVQTLNKEKGELFSQVQNLQAKIKNIEEKSSKELKNVRFFYCGRY